MFHLPVKYTQLPVNLNWNPHIAYITHLKREALKMAPLEWRLRR